jgi:hypothetical protein
MRDFLRSMGRRVRVGWFWPLALLTFPMCALFVGFESFAPGPSPVSSAVMCDIPKPPIEEVSDCADPDEAAMGLSLASAAIALNLGEINDLVLDFSQTTECGGQPKKIETVVGCFFEHREVVRNDGFDFVKGPGVGHGWSGRILRPQIVQELRRGANSGHQQEVTGARAGHVEQVALGLVDVLQIRFVRHVRDSGLQRHNLTVPLRTSVFPSTSLSSAASRRSA